MSGLFVFLFLTVLAAVMVACSVGFAVVESRGKKQVATVLRTVADAQAPVAAPVVLMRKADQSDFIRRVLQRFNLVDRLQTAISQGGLEWTVNGFAFATLVLAAIGLVLGLKVRVLAYGWLSSLGLAAALSMVPSLYVRHKRKKRFAEFEQQFPEALDFLARAMRAGHAFSVSLEMMGQESPDPLGREFRALFNEQNLGANIDVALANLIRRVPLIDVRFFVSAVMLQRQTGGNLSEILTRLGYVIRERFRLKGAVKAASAHGRITAVVLTLMPILVTAGLMVIAPAYLASMTKDADGRRMILGAVLGQAAGYYFIRRIINVKV